LKAPGRFSADGQIIFFASERAGGFWPDRYLYVEKAANGNWAIAQNLGKNINTKYKEDFPRLADDGKKRFFCFTGPFQPWEITTCLKPPGMKKQIHGPRLQTWIPGKYPDDDRCITFTSNNRVAIFPQHAMGDKATWIFTESLLTCRSAYCHRYRISSFAGFDSEKDMWTRFLQ